MADLMWGGVPRILPSDTCLKYQNDVKNKVLVSSISIKVNGNFD